jgi:hypothetical protein
VAYKEREFTQTSDSDSVKINRNPDILKNNLDDAQAPPKPRRSSANSASKFQYPNLTSDLQVPSNTDAKNVGFQNSRCFVRFLRIKIFKTFKLNISRTASNNDNLWLNEKLKLLVGWNKLFGIGWNHGTPETLF